VPVETVLFDCDGTLVDSETLTMEVLVEYAAEHGVTLDLAETLAAFAGGTMADVVRDLERRRGAALPEHFVPEFRRRQARAFRARLRPMDGARALLEAIRLPCCVVSSGPREKIELSLGLTGLRRFFDGRIFSSYEVGTWKPEPGIFLHAAERQGVAPGACAVVEDSLPGIRAGRAAGMRVFAYRPAGHPPLPEPLPEDVVRIRHLSELAPYLER
jgi:HAD superfamily hydrolase (TIGR01509 family)